MCWMHISVKKGLLAHNVKTLQPALPHSQISHLQHSICLRYIHRSSNGIAKMGAWFLHYFMMRMMGWSIQCRFIYSYKGIENHQSVWYYSNLTSLSAQHYIDHKVALLSGHSNASTLKRSIFYCTLSVFQTDTYPGCFTRQSIYQFFTKLKT